MGKLHLFTTFQLSSLLRLETSAFLAVRDTKLRARLLKKILLCHDFQPIQRLNYQEKRFCICCFVQCR